MEWSEFCLLKERKGASERVKGAAFGASFLLGS